jgi:uncharacterized protein RhaS with RHS repeats
MMTSAQSATYIYDGDGNQVKSIINNVVTYYVGRHYHKTVNGANVSIKKFYAIGMSQVAVRTNGDLQWILTDHLSSASVSASVDGTLVSEVKYSAFGEWGMAAYNGLMTLARKSTAWWNSDDQTLTLVEAQAILYLSEGYNEFQIQAATKKWQH